ncbi:MAG: hypothetical protein JXR83_03575, partial [Deltaproteobacteria bacterium]|nr:hypothetical protein [Deltaproteobacteria bacterium]
MAVEAGQVTGKTVVKKETGVGNGRDPVLLDVKLKYESIAEFDAGFAANVSTNVVFLKTPSPKQVGTPVTLQLRLRNGTPVLRGEGRVLWACRSPTLPPGRQGGMGIAFFPADAESADRMRAIVAAHGAGANATAPGARLLQLIASAPAETGEAETPAPQIVAPQPPDLIPIPRRAPTSEPADDIGSAFDAIRSDIAIPVPFADRSFAPPPVAPPPVAPPPVAPPPVAPTAFAPGSPAPAAANAGIAAQAANAAAADGPTELDDADLMEISDDEVALVETPAAETPLPVATAPVPSTELLSPPETVQPVEALAPTTAQASQPEVAPAAIEPSATPAIAPVEVAASADPNAAALDLPAGEWAQLVSSLDSDEPPVLPDSADLGPPPAALVDPIATDPDAMPPQFDGAMAPTSSDGNVAAPVAVEGELPVLPAFEAAPVPAEPDQGSDAQVPPPETAEIFESVGWELAVTAPDAPIALAQEELAPVPEPLAYSPAPDVPGPTPQPIEQPIQEPAPQPIPELTQQPTPEPI